MWFIYLYIHCILSKLTLTREVYSISLFIASTVFVAFVTSFAYNIMRKGILVNDDNLKCVVPCLARQPAM